MIFHTPDDAMAKKSGSKIQSLVRLLQFLSSVIILGICCYFLVIQNRHNLYQPSYVKVVGGIAGASVLWTALAMGLTPFFSGVTVFCALAVVLDSIFFGSLLGAACLTRQGRSCSGSVDTPLGSGDVRTQAVTTQPGNDPTLPPSGYRPNLMNACRLLMTVFIVAIILR